MAEFKTEQEFTELRLRYRLIAVVNAVAMLSQDYLVLQPDGIYTRGSGNTQPRRIVEHNGTPVGIEEALVQAFESMSTAK